MQSSDAHHRLHSRRALNQGHHEGSQLHWSAPLVQLHCYRATLAHTDSSAQQAKTTQKNEPVQSCPVPVEVAIEGAGPLMFPLSLLHRREKVVVFGNHYLRRHGA